MIDRTWGRSGAFLVLLTLAVGASAAEARGSGRFDIAMTTLSQAPVTLQTGGSFTASYAMRQRGRARVRSVQVAFHLSRDARRGGDTRLGGARAVKGRALAKLTGKRGLPGRVRLTVPSGLDAGAYRLIGCVADVRAKPKVRERNRRNNCRTASRTITVRAPSAPPVEPAVTTPVGPAPGGVEGRPLPTGPAVDPANPVQAANPRSVTPTLAANRKSVAVIGPVGGTVAATAADGSTFTLTVPANALIGQTVITLTPLASIAGLPFSGGLVTGVDVQPHGLRLQRPATLAFAPASPVATGSQAPFAYAAGGRDMHLYPLAADPARLEMQLMHFSGYGIASAPPSERAEQAGHAPADAEAQLEQQAARFRESLRNGDPAFEREFVDFSRTYWQQVVRPRLLAAETDDRLAGVAVSGFISWARQLALLGLDAGF
jgi:hypothetical protein